MKQAGRYEDQSRVALRVRLCRFFAKKFKRFWHGAPQDGPLRHGRIWFDALNGMAIGFLATIVAGTLIGLVGRYSASNVFRDVSRIMTLITPFAIGVSIGYQRRLDGVRTISLAIAVFIAARSDFIPRAVAGQMDFLSAAPRISVDVTRSGDVLSTVVTGALMLYLFYFTRHWRTSLDFLLVPLMSMLVGVAIAFSFTYLVVLFTACLQLIIYYTALQSAAWALGLAPVLGALMGLALALPMSSAALAVSLKLTGDAALAAAVGGAAHMVAWGVLTHWAGRNWLQSFTIAFGSPKLHTANYLRRPQILLLPTAIAAVSALLAVAIYRGQLAFPLSPTGEGVITSGMGTVVFTGQIFTLIDHGSNLLSWTNVVFLQLLVPFALAVPLVYLTGRFCPRLLQKSWLKLGAYARVSH